jgi:hypothetical protein
VRRFVTIHLRGQVARDQRDLATREFTGKDPSIGCAEVARSRGSKRRIALDPEHRRTVGSGEGSYLGTSQEKVREFGHGDHEVAR